MIYFCKFYQNFQKYILVNILKTADSYSLYTGFLEKSIAFNWIFSKIPTKNSIQSDTFFPETLYMIV